MLQVILYQSLKKTLKAFLSQPCSKLAFHYCSFSLEIWRADDSRDVAMSETIVNVSFPVAYTSIDGICIF